MDFSGSDICRFNRYRSTIQRWWLLQALRYALNHRRRSLPCFFIARIAFSVRRPPNVQILPIVINPTFFSEATKLGLNISRIVSKLGGKILHSVPPNLRFVISAPNSSNMSGLASTNSTVGSLSLSRPAPFFWCVELRKHFFQSCKYIRFLFLVDQISAWSIMHLRIKKETIQVRNRNKIFSRVQTLIPVPW